MINNLGFAMGCLFLTGSAIEFFHSFSMEYYGDLRPGPGLFPRWLSGALMAASLLYAAGEARRHVIRWSDAMPRGCDLYHVASVPVTVAAFMLALPWVGFVPAGAAMLFALLVRSYSRLRAAAAAVIASVLLYIVFREGLDVPLPTGILWERLG